MRLFGNLMNRIDESARQPAPEVGQGATILHYSDRSAGTVIKVEHKARQTIVTVQEDKATRTDKNGMSETQDYSYEPNPNGPISTFRLNDRGTYDQVRFNTKTSRFNKVEEGHGLLLGARDAYYDYSF